MKVITLEEIRAFNPCYDPGKYLQEGWSGTALDILNVTECPANDRLWVVLRNYFFTDKELRIFAVWCARKALSIPGNENDICSNTCDVAERYANGEATDQELSAARSAAWYAAWSAARSAASDAARSAASDAARSAAWSAARSAAWSAARSAASDAAWDAAWSAAWSAARSAAWSAARSAASDAQINQLKVILSWQK